MDPQVTLDRPTTAAAGDVASRPGASDEGRARWRSTSRWRPRTTGGGLPGRRGPRLRLLRRRPRRRDRRAAAPRALPRPDPRDEHPRHRAGPGRHRRRARGSAGAGPTSATAAPSSGRAARGVGGRGRGDARPPARGGVVRRAGPPSLCGRRGHHRAAAGCSRPSRRSSPSRGCGPSPRPGSVVGSLSGIGTVGAITGTVLTGFVLLSRVAVSYHGRPRGGPGRRAPSSSRWGSAGGRPPWRRPSSSPAAWRRPSSRAAATSRRPTTAPGSRPTPPARAAARSSWTTCATPTSTSTTRTDLELRLRPRARRGGRRSRCSAGGRSGAPPRRRRATMPRWLATRPGSRSLVSEVDPRGRRVGREQLGLRTSDDLQVRVEDGRVGLTRAAERLVRLRGRRRVRRRQRAVAPHDPEALGEVHRVLGPTASTP